MIKRNKTEKNCHHHDITMTKSDLGLSLLILSCSQRHVFEDCVKIIWVFMIV